MLTFIHNVIKYIKKTNDSKNVIVLDMDKTIGDFDLVSYLHFVLMSNHVQNNDIRSHVLTVFSECFRPQIFDIFKLFIAFKKEQMVHKLVLYTNNTGGKRWISVIVDYIHSILQYKLFDDQITGYIVNDNEIADNRRTTETKSITDIYSILNIDSSYHILFIDDMLHQNMLSTNSNVFYIHVKPYVYRYSFYTISKRLVEHYKIILSPNIKQYIKNILKYEYNASMQQYVSLYDTNRMNTLINNITKYFIANKTGYLHI